MNRVCPTNIIILNIIQGKNKYIYFQGIGLTIARFLLTEETITSTSTFI